MKNWSFLEWLAFAALGIATLGQALGAALKDQAALLSVLPFWTGARIWAYVPGVAYLIALFVFCCEFFLRRKASAESSAPQVGSAPEITPKKRFYSAAEKDELATRLSQISGILKNEVLPLSLRWEAMARANVADPDDPSGFRSLTSKFEALNTETLEINSRLWQDVVHGNQHFRDELRGVVSEHFGLGDLIIAGEPFRGGLALAAELASNRGATGANLAIVLRPIQNNMVRVANETRRWIEQCLMRADKLRAEF